ncbi:MAG: N-acetylmuramoyl-L-alanine amidase [Phycisphaerae bacterium]
MNRCRPRRCLVALLPLIGLSACRAPAPRPTATQPAFDRMTSVNTLLPAPDDFAKARIGSGDYPIPPYAKHLKGVKVVLDPGHGGDAHQRGFKRGPTGVREAEINLRVAHYLRDFLLHVGAEVRLTRESDVDSTLQQRAAVANDWPADIFISLHHNAIDNKPQTNYTTVWYHDSVDHRPSSLDLARYLCDGLYDALRLPQVTDVPLKTDKLMYAAGFGVLRTCEVTGALTESSFYTNPEEEQRLRDPAYNLREAYGLFRALAKYAAAGLPRATLVEPADGRVSLGGPRWLTFVLDDGLRSRKAWGHERPMIFADSIVVRLDGERLPHEFTSADYRVSAPLPPTLASGEHRVEIQFQNMNKNSVLSPGFTITVPAASTPESVTCAR